VASDTPAGETPGNERLEIVVPESAEGTRFDWFLAQQLPTYSRTLLRRAINAATIRIDGLRAKAAHRLRTGERISLELPALPREGPRPENIPLKVLYEDEHFAVIDKPPGMVVHPGKGHWSGTLTSALQFHFDQLSEVGGPTRPGIIHRLDRDTSGVIAVAKNDRAHLRLAEQFADRTVEKEYFAIVCGAPNLDRDLIDLPIGPHPYQREKMAVRREESVGRPAQSFYEVQERFDGFAAVHVRPKTGRTHQIRLHLASIHCPVLCDKLYGGRARLTRAELERRLDEDSPVLLERQALHARRLKIAHPVSGEVLEFVAPLPDDLASVLAELRQLRRL
jgi:23S rRNA pseudouridine1911/1915/1917 synthase